MMIDTTKTNNFILYSTNDNNINVQILADKENETVWLNQKQLAEIFDCSTDNISLHIKNILKDGELDVNSVVEEFSVTATDGKNYKVKHYNLDMIISIGYRVNSYTATQFRVWATKTLKEFIVKGFVLDDERLKQGNNVFNKNYFNELLERIREIRASEKLFYEKVKEVFTLSTDYDSKSDKAKLFFAQCQNKLEYAVIGMTSAEIINKRANYRLPHMGLSTWSGDKRDKDLIQKDVTVAKNYLTEDEVKDLNRLTTMLLDYVENQTQMGKLFEMKDWLSKLDGFLQFNEYEVLQDYGKVQKDFAHKFAIKEYKKYKEIQMKMSISDIENIIQKKKV